MSKVPTPDGYVLSEDQLKTLERTIQYVNRVFKSRPYGQLGDDSLDHEEFPTPEVYVARTPPEGIQGFDSQTDMSVGTGAYPYSAECYVYLLHPSNEHMENQIFTQTVYNLSSVSIEGNKWIIALRDKFGTWYAIDLHPSSSSGFPARITAGYEVTTGYPWERTILNEDGTFSAHPSGQSGQYAYSPDENEELPAGTNGWLFPNPDSIGTDTDTGTSTAHDPAYDTWIFIPVYRTRTTCIGTDGTLVHQISTDGGETWVTLEDLGVECNPNIGTGTTTDDAPGGGACELVRLRTTDCILAVGPENSIQLEYSAGHWVSPSGTGPEAYLTYFDGLCSGLVDFWYEAGRVRLTVNDLELLHCGNNCFTGGPLTFHYPCTGTGSLDDLPCEGRVFTVCLSCQECMYWYCVATTGECEGTGTLTPTIEILELTDTEALELADQICNGPYNTEEDAILACATIDCASIPLILQIVITPDCPDDLPDDVPLESFDMGETWICARTTECGPLEPESQGWSLTMTCNEITGKLTYTIYDGNTYNGDVLILSTAPLHLQIVYTPSNGSCCDGIEQTIDITEP